MKNTLIVIAILLLCLDGIGVYRAFTEYRNLNQQLQQEADYVRDINLISQKNQEYYQSLSSISDNFYTDERLYNLWRTMEDKFGANLDSLAIDPNYIEENGLRWFTFNISVRTNPKAFLQTVKSISPPLFVQSISYNKSANVLTAPVRGAIVSDYSGFVITASTITESNYVVCRYIMNTKDKNLIPDDPTYLVSEKDGTYYVGIPLQRNLDALAAENVANQYAQQGMVTFIAKDSSGK